MRLASLIQPHPHPHPHREVGHTARLPGPRMKQARVYLRLHEAGLQGAYQRRAAASAFILDELEDICIGPQEDDPPGTPVWRTSGVGGRQSGNLRRSWLEGE